MREGRGKETGKRREAEEEEGSSAAEEAGGKADSRVRFGKAEEAGGTPGGRGCARRRRGRSCRRPMGAQTRGRAGAAGPALRQGRPAGGLEQRSSQAASRARGSPAACYLPLPSPALTVNASRGRFPARGAYFGRRAVDFPRLLLFARGSGPFGALAPRFSRRLPNAYLRLIRLGGRPTC